VIRDELVAASPAHAGEFRANAKGYVEGLHKLKKDGREMLERRSTSHHHPARSLRYLPTALGEDRRGGAADAARSRAVTTWRGW